MTSILDITTQEEDINMSDTLYNGKRKRLMIEKLIMENFKSYGGIQEISGFGSRMSCVIGSNGSGKSNSIDALLFVFGKRAKQLRLNRVSELIHKSENYPNLEYAKVSVYFQEIIDLDENDPRYDPNDLSANYMVVPNSQIIVSRLANKNNTSTYSINNKTTNYTEVGKLLRSKGIDLDNNRFLILQGEVEQISLMPPKGKTENDVGLLEYLEDIIGSNRFLDDINKLNKEVEELNDKRMEKLNRLRITERERNGLEGSKIEAEGYIKKERQLRKKRNIYYQYLNYLSTNKNNEFNEKMNELNNLLLNENKKLENEDNEIKEMEKLYENGSLEYNRLNKELQKTKDEYTSYERREIKYQEDKKHLKKELKKMNNKLNKDNEILDNLRNDLNDKINEKPEYEEKLNIAINNKNIEETKYEEIENELKNETEGLRKELELKKVEFAPLKTNAEEINNNINTLQSEINLLQEESIQANEQYNKIFNELNEKNNLIEKNNNELNDLNDSFDRINKRLEDIDIDINEKKINEENLINQRKDFINDIETKKLILRNSSSIRTYCIQRIMQEKNKDNSILSDVTVYGRLGDLATINEEYDIAISTACGMLDFIVVQSTDDASKCIKFLRDNNIGRSSFLVLDKLDSARQRMEQEFIVPNNTQRLFDIININDNNLLPAFYQALGNTLVADNLDIAENVAFKGDKKKNKICIHRIVTLDGKLIDISGTLSGGGNQVRRGGMLLFGDNNNNNNNNDNLIQLEVSPEDIKEMENQLDNLTHDIKELRQNITNLNTEKRYLLKNKKKTNLDKSKLEMLIESTNNLIPELEERLNELNDKKDLTNEQEERINELNIMIENYQNEYNEGEPLLTKLDNEIKVLQKSIVDIGNKELKEQKIKLNKTSKIVDDIISTIETIDVDIRNIEKKINNKEKSINKLENEINETNEKLELIEKESKELEDNAIIIIEAYERAEKIAKDKSIELEQLQKHFTELKEKLNKLKSSQVDYQSQIEDLQNLINDNNAKIEHYKRKLNELNKNHKQDIEEFGLFDNNDNNNNNIIDDINNMENNIDQENDDNNDNENNNNEIKNDDNEDDIILDDINLEEKDNNNDEKENDDEIYKLPILNIELLQQLDENSLKEDINIIEQEKNELKENINMSALSEYRKKDIEYKKRLDELEDATTERNNKRNDYDSLRRKRLEEFMSGFSQITLKLKEMYQMITLGGDAELELVDSLDPFSEGIVFSVRPPKKSWKNISNLSGGEKTLSSLALVFALHHYKPTPLYVMDEIDAALDFKNVSIVANYIKERTKNAQFIIISLRNNMFELADRLVGIYKTHNVTKSVTINPRKFNMDMNDENENENKENELNQTIVEDTNDLNKTIVENDYDDDIIQPPRKSKRRILNERNEEDDNDNNKTELDI